MFLIGKNLCIYLHLFWNYESQKFAFSIVLQKLQIQINYKIKKFIVFSQILCVGLSHCFTDCRCAWENAFFV